MSLIIHSIDPENNSSPFDEIRGYRADGSEYWTARELMKWLGYTSWKQGSIALNRACKSIANQGFDVTLQVVEVCKLSNQHNGKVVEIVDYELSRFACYVAAMNADPEKDMVAQAQGYFANQAYKQEQSVVPKSPAEMLMVYAQMFLEQERRQLAIELEQKIQAEEIAHLKLINETQDLEIAANSQELERFKNGHGYWFTVAGWCSKNSVKKSLEELKVLGRQAAALCRMREISPEKVNDPRWGTVGCYPDSVLMELVI